VTEPPPEPPKPEPDWDRLEHSLRVVRRIRLTLGLLALVVVVAAVLVRLR
jgi:hypothetical protein